MRTRYAAVVLAVLPWGWYVVRDLHPWFDVLALAWPPLGFGVAWLLLGWTLLGRRTTVAAASVSWLVATAAVVVLPWSPRGAQDVARPIAVVGANVHGWSADVPNAVRELVRKRADVLVVSEATKQLHDRLAPNFPFAIHVGDVGVYARFPLRELGPAPVGQRGIRVGVRSPAGPFTLYALHLQKPGLTQSEVEVGFRTHRRIVDAVVDQIRDERLPVMVVGDLNLVERSSGYRRLTSVTDDAMRADWSGPSSRRPRTRPLLARVDHILIPESWCSARSGLFDIPGSDHRGVAASVGRCR